MVGLKEEEAKVDQNLDGKKFTDKLKCTECQELATEALKSILQKGGKGGQRGMQTERQIT
jgi:hypothetical protein